MVQDVEPNMEGEMEWEDAPDVDKALRRLVAKTKSKESKMMHQVKSMVGDIVEEDLVDMVELAYVEWDMVDTLVAASSMEGSIRTIWRQLDLDSEVKTRIKRMMNEEEEEEEERPLKEES